MKYEIDTSMAQWQVFVSEATYPSDDKGNPILKLCICRYCGAADNDHDPHIPDEYKNRVSYESCSRCGFDLYAEEE